MIPARSGSRVTAEGRQPDDTGDATQPGFGRRISHRRRADRGPNPMSLTLCDDPPPFFSVIICTFNRAHLLPRALDSLLAQEETSWEAIVVDDGSTDNTHAVVRRYLAQTPN